jgi:serine protease AprX
MTGADGIVMTGADGIVMTGADSFLNTRSDGIVMTGADGIVMTGADGIVMTGADSFAYPNSVRAISADGVNVTNANGIVMTGADGIVMTGADGEVHQADSVTITLANGIVMTGADGIVMTGADGIQRTSATGIVMTGADGIVMTGADGIVMTGADSLRAVGADGVAFSVAPNGLHFAGVTGIVMTGADGIVMTGADGIVITGADGIVMTGADSASSGLLSVDPELAVQLNRLTDDSTVNAVVVYHQLPSDGDLATLQNIGIAGGTRFRALPMVIITGTRNQIMEISRLPSVRSIYGNRTVTLNSEPEVRAVTGVERARSDQDISGTLQNLPVAGRNVTVAVLDTGIDGTHNDLAGRVTRNLKLADAQSLGVGFNYPVYTGTLPNTDLVYGHGSFVAGLIAGSGARSNGRYSGVAPAANLVGLSAGDLSLLYILSGFDYLLSHRAELGVRVMNCSFSANTVFDMNDPVNVATKLLTDAGVSIVFSAGNTGPGAHTLNPYAVAPWVVSVGATDTQARLTSFSSRGDFASGLFRPTLVAPGLSVVSVRGSGITNVTGAEGLVSSDIQRLTPSEIPYYTTASGTSFSAPQVAGTIALMLEANPTLTPSKIKEILQLTATPLAPYYAHETGAGMLNVHAAVLQAAFVSRRIGVWRGTLDRAQVSFYNDPLVTFTGVVQPGISSDTNLQIPSDALFSSLQMAWGPLWSTNDLGLYVYNPAGNLQAQSNVVNVSGLTGKRERVALTMPTTGTWRISVRNTLGVAGSSQPYSGTLEIGRASYGRMADIAGLPSTLREDIYQNIRSFSMWPIGARFRPEWSVTRGELATSLVLGARVPQYLSGAPMFQDVINHNARLFVESAQTLPSGALFTDVSTGGTFRPNESVTRIVAAVALVRAAGLRPEAENRAGIVLPFLDSASIPPDLRGYVSVAIGEGFMQGDTLFRPQGNFNRADLARAIAAIQRRAVR